MNTKENDVLKVSGDMIVEVASALSSKTRLEILKNVRDKEVDVEELTDIIKQSKANVSAQLRILEKSGLIKTIYKPGIRGVKKICTSNIKEIVFIIE